MSELDDMDEDSHSAHSRDRAGGTVSIRDSRMSALVSIDLAITPVAVIGIGVWIANSINTLNTTVTRLVVQIEAIILRLDQADSRNDKQDAKNDEQDALIYQNSRDIAAMGGPNYRGGPRGR